MRVRAYRQISSIMRREHSQWLVALGSLFALVDRQSALWVSSIAVVIIAAFSFLSSKFRIGSRWIRWFCEFEAFCFGCIAMAATRLLADFALDLMRLPSQPRSVLWVASIVLLGGWAGATIRKLSLFAYGVIQIASGVVVGINSQTFIKSTQGGGLELIALMTSVYLVARGFGDCSDANAIADRDRASFESEEQPSVQAVSVKRILLESDGIGTVVKSPQC